MENIHKLTKQTMELVGQTVRNTPSIPTQEEMKLRLALEFEELKEKAQAMGLEGSFANIVDSFVMGCIKTIQDNHYDIAPTQSRTLNFELLNTGVVDLVEVLDAALDQRVVASGTDLCFGMQNCIVQGDVAVWTSNMSKFDKEYENALDGVLAYREGTHPHSDKKIDAYILSKDGYHIIKNSENHKYLKSLHYSPVDLRSLVGIEEPVNTQENVEES